MRVAKLKERMWAKGRIIAPYNTTQFLMADQAEDDCYYASSSPANDQDFMSNEFKKDYEVHNLNRLEKMSKEMLLNEYMMLERKNEKLEEKLKTIKDREDAQEVESNNGGLFTSPEVEYASQVMKLQTELAKLKMENQRLVAENSEMKKRLSNESESEESSDSESSTSSSSSDMDLESLLEDKQTTYRENQTSDDPGYESNQSKGGIK